MLRPLLHIINHEVKLYARKGGEVVTIVGFFFIAITLFPFALGADNPELSRMAPALIWVVALLAALLSAPSIMHRDIADGSLDQLRLAPVALEWVVCAKCLGNWIACHLPLILLSPVAAMMLGTTQEQGSRLMLSLLIGTPVLSCVGALGSALTAHAANKSGILAVLILPLYTPILIFATIIAGNETEAHAIALPETKILLGMLCLAWPLSCWATAWVMRLQE
jgi:heme exporter protein B